MKNTSSKSTKANAEGMLYKSEIILWKQVSISEQ